MAKADAVRSGKPFADPSADEIFEILIPEGAESGKIPSGDDYILQCLSVTFGKAKSSGNPMYTFVFTIFEGDYKGMDFELYCPLTDNALWKLSDTLTALGQKVTPGKPMKVRASDLKGVLVRGVIIDDKTNTGREVSKLQATLPHPDGAGTKGGKGFVVPKKADEDEEDEEQPVARGKKNLDWHTGEDEDEKFPAAKGGKNGRRAVAEDEDEDEVPPARRRRPADEDEDEEDERPKARRRTEPEDEEEEDDRPARRSAPAARGGKRSRL